jgi:hypothetical protein
MQKQGKLAIIGGRLAQAIPALIGIIIVTFLLTRALPGDPAAYFAGPAADAASIEEIHFHGPACRAGTDRAASGFAGADDFRAADFRRSQSRSAFLPRHGPIAGSTMPVASSPPPVSACRHSLPGSR